jgi:hypothetical protein
LNIGIEYYAEEEARDQARKEKKEKKASGRKLAQAAKCL